MTGEQTIQKLNWLDEEHRRDRVAITELNAKIENYLPQINGLTKGLQDLEERLARVQGQSLRYSQIESALAQLKTEVNVMFEQADRRAQQRESEYLQVRVLDRRENRRGRTEPAIHSERPRRAQAFGRRAGRVYSRH